jgi:phosphate transport system permease protein
VAIVFYVLKKGLGVISVDFLTKDIPILTRSIGPGMGPAIAGTLLITGTATAMAVPLGILAAVYLNEYGKKNRLAAVIRTMSDVMTGVPSIVMGLFVYTIWVLRFGLSGFAGALALACLMLPIVIRSTEEILRLVPAGLREASLALGASRARTIMTVVLPAAVSGITSGALLAVARAAGETAPLLFTIGASRRRNWDVLHGANTALSTQIFRNAQQPFPGAQERAWGAALTLIVLVVVLTILARVITKRFAVPVR